MRVAVRGWGDGRKLFDEVIDADEEALETIAPRLIQRVIGYKRNMLEIEFLDEPNNNERYFRFGSDPTMMVEPIQVKL